MKNAAQRICTRKNRLRCSRERAWQKGAKFPIWKTFEKIVKIHVPGEKCIFAAKIQEIQCIVQQLAPFRDRQAVRRSAFSADPLISPFAAGSPEDQWKKRKTVQIKSGSCIPSSAPVHSGSYMSTSAAQHGSFGMDHRKFEHISAVSLIALQE